ncbi:hypothetical protein ACFX15_020558 [Malus domestica]|nr:uncharacterized protein LOC103416532 [Malus domestica]
MSGETRSVFLVAHCWEMDLSGAVYRVKLQGGVPLDLEPVYQFFEKEPLPYLHSQCARIFSNSNSKLHRMVHSDSDAAKPPTFIGYNCAMDTTSETFPAPKTPKPLGSVVSAYGHIYHIADPLSGTPECSSNIPNPSFERYKPGQETWETLPHFPYYIECRYMYICGYAVCHGWILFSLRHMNGVKSKIYAFHIKTQEWHRVTSGHTGFVGRAVVVDQTIYGLSLSCDKVLVFSFGISYGEEGRNIACSLSTPIPLQVLDSALKPSRFSELTGQLVHLGDKDFCLVQTRDNEYSCVHQDICITTIQIIAGEEGCPMIKTVRSTVYTVDTNELGHFGIYCSFTPELKDVEPEEGEIVAVQEPAKSKG